MPTTTSQALVLMSKQNGIVLIPAATVLTRLNYFDGKFLRAKDLKAEQDYLRQLVRKSNQAGGSGVAHGFDLSRGVGDTLNLGPGLAIDPEGRVLLLPQGASINVPELIEKSRDLEKLSGKTRVTRAGDFETCEVKSATTPVVGQQASNLYVIMLCAAEALCGEEDVYGKLCEEACATSTDRPYAVEGVIVRAVPLVLQTPLPHSKAVTLTQVHLRSRVAAAYFADERQVVNSLISGEDLKQATWCMGADAYAEGCVPIGVIARAGTSTAFVDPWIVRRELIDTPARRYWQWRMMMRPWDVFLAQILQFQCQLRDLVSTTPELGVEADPCGDARTVIVAAAKKITDVMSVYREMNNQQGFGSVGEGKAGAGVFAGAGAFNSHISELEAMGQRLTSTEQQMTIVTEDGVLTRRGIIELPSAGYLPVVPGANMTINKQVRQWMGQGVDLRFCVVRPDYVAHALEEAQHLERISLIEGLEDKAKKPQVDILVPDGEIIEEKPAPPRNLFEATVTAGLLNGPSLEKAGLGNFSVDVPSVRIDGAARTEVLPTGGGAFHMAARGGLFRQVLAATPSDTATAAPTATETATATDTAAAPQAATASKGRFGGAQEPGDVLDNVVVKTLFGGFERLIGKAVEADAKRAAADGQHKSASRATAQQTATMIQQGSSKEPTGSLWLTMRSDRNILELGSNETSEVRLQALMAVNIPGQTVNVDVFLGGTFLVEESATAPGNNGKVVGRLSGTASLSAEAGGLEIEKNGLPFTVALSIDPGGSSGSRRRKVTIGFDEAAFDVEFITTWGDDPLQIESVLEVVINSRLNLNNLNNSLDRSLRLTLMQARFRANPAVFEPNNNSHQEAVTAIEDIADGLDDAGFVERTSRILFPPPPPPSEELIVRGTRDWVLFHRRRNKNCQSVAVATPPPPPPVVKSVCHTFFRAESRSAFARATERIGAARTTEGIQSAIANAELELLGHVQFKEGTASLFGNGSTLAKVVKLWAMKSKGVGAVATVQVRRSERDSLTYSKQMNAVLSEIDDDAGGVETQRVFTSVTLPTECSVFTIFAAADDSPMEIGTTCVSVFQIFEQDVQAFARAADGNKLEEAFGMLGTTGSAGNIVFKTRTADPLAGSLEAVKREWQQVLKAKAPVSGLILARKDSSELDRTAFKRQADLLRQTLGANVSLPEMDVRVADFPSTVSCEAIILLAEPRPAPPPPAIELTCLRVIRVLFPQNMRFIETEIAAGRSSIIDSALGGQFGPVLGAVTFRKGTTEASEASLSDLRRQLDGPDIADVEDTLIVATLSATTAERTTFQNQTAFLRETFGGREAEAQIPTLLTAKLPAAVGCPALVFLAVPSFGD